jgi:hypothetical protein
VLWRDSVRALGFFGQVGVKTKVAAGDSSVIETIHKRYTYHAVCVREEIIWCQSPTKNAYRHGALQILFILVDALLHHVVHEHQVYPVRKWAKLTDFRFDFTAMFADLQPMSSISLHPDTPLSDVLM